MVDFVKIIFNCDGGKQRTVKNSSVLSSEMQRPVLRWRLINVLREGGGEAEIPSSPCYLLQGSSFSPFYSNL
jgi:hypothetical protein